MKKTIQPRSRTFNIFSPSAILLACIMLLTSNYYSVAQVRPDITNTSLFTTAEQEQLACSIKVFLDAHHWDYVMKHISPCPLDPDCVVGDVREQIHNNPNFLPWHRHFIGKLEEHLVSIGLSEYVPLPYWNPATIIPDDFFDLDCALANDIAFHNEWDPLAPLVNQDITGMISSAQTFWADMWSGSTTCNPTSRAALSSAMGPLGGPHGTVHGAIGGAMGSVHAAPGTGLFYLWHGFVDDVWRKWECTCNNSPSWPQITGADLYMKDYDSDLGDATSIPPTTMLDGLDMGYEPFVSNRPMWTSEDIWVRNQDDGRYNLGVNLNTTNQGIQEHQTPEYTAGSAVSVYVRVRNRGCTASASTGSRLKVYWAKAGTALAWDSDWDGSVTCITSGEVMGDMIGSQVIPAIEGGDHTILRFAWNVPNPEDYESPSCGGNGVGGTATEHFCLLARIETDVNQPYGMTEPEISDVNYNTQQNNNIVWKNIAVLNDVAGIIGGGWSLTGCVIVNSLDAAEKTRLYVTEPPENRINSIFDQSEQAVVTLQLSAELFQAWVAGGMEGDLVAMIGPGVIQILEPGAWIGNLDLDPTNRYNACVNVIFASPHLSERKNFNIDLVQMDEADDLKIIGGERFVIKLPSLPELRKSGESNEIENSFADAFVLMPNPAMNDFTLTIRGEISEYRLSICDVLGREVYKQDLPAEAAHKINIAGIQQGIYFLEMLNKQSGKKLVEKLVIQ